MTLCISNGQRTSGGCRRCSRCTLYYWKWNAPPWPRATCRDSRGIYFVFHLHSPGTLFACSFFHYYFVSNLHIVRASWFWSWHAPPCHYLRPWERAIPRPDSLHRNLLPYEGLAVLCASASLHRVLLLLLLHLKFIRQLQVKS